GPDVKGAHAGLAEIAADALQQVRAKTKSEPDAVVFLLCNAPTVTDAMIEHALAILRDRPELDGVAAASRHNEFHPSAALRLRDDGTLSAHLAHKERSDAHADAYFADALLWALRPRVLDVP